MFRLPVTLLLLFAAACGETDHVDQSDAQSDARPSVIDSAVGAADARTGCPEESKVEIGGCNNPASTDPCMGFGDNLEFVELAEGASLQPIVGFQGTAMFVVALRASGINPGPEGTPLDWPTVAVELHDPSDAVVAQTESKPRLEEISAGLFQGFEMQLPYPGDFDQFDGVALRVTMHMTDMDGTLQCGERAIVGTKAFVPGG